MGCHKLDISEQKFTTLKVVHKSLWHSVNTCAGAYLFGFNGKEYDSEWNGNPGAMYDYGFRIYDARIARFLSADPLIVQGQQYPELSPYQYASNRPIDGIDLDGLEWQLAPAAVAAIDFALIATGVITTGVLLDIANDGSIKFNANAHELYVGTLANLTTDAIFGGLATTLLIDYSLNSPDIERGWKEQQRQERETGKKIAEAGRKIAESIEANITGRTPAGDPMPKGGGSEFAKWIIGGGLVGASIHEYYKNTKVEIKKENPVSTEDIKVGPAIEEEKISIDIDIAPSESEYEYIWSD